MTRITLTTAICFGLVGAIGFAVAQNTPRGAGDQAADAVVSDDGDVGRVPPRAPDDDAAVQLTADDARLTADEIRVHLEDSKNLYGAGHPVIIRLEKLLRHMEQLERERTEALALAKRQAQTAARTEQLQKAQAEALLAREQTETAARREQLWKERTEGDLPRALAVQSVPRKWIGAGAEYDLVEVSRDGFSAYVGMARADESVQLLLNKWKAAEPGEQREEIEKQLRGTLTGQFERQLRTHEGEVSRLEEKVQSLREQMQRRHEKQQEIIDFRLEQLLRDAQGLGWTPDQTKRAIDSAKDYSGDSTPPAGVASPQPGGLPMEMAAGVKPAAVTGVEPPVTIDPDVIRSADLALERARQELKAAEDRYAKSRDQEDANAVELARIRVRQAEQELATA